MTRLLVAASAAAGVSALLRPAFPRPAGRTVPVEQLAAAPGTATPALTEGCGAGVAYSQPAAIRLGLRPAAAHRDTPPAAAGPIVAGGAL